MTEGKFPASLLMHNTAKIAGSVHLSKHELFKKMQILLFSFLTVTFKTLVYSRCAAHQFLKLIIYFFI